MRAEIDKANTDSMFSKEELHWEGDAGVRITPSFLKVLLLGFPEEIVRGIHRLVGAYDTSVYAGGRVPPQGTLPQPFLDA